MRRTRLLFVLLAVGIVLAIPAQGRYGGTTSRSRDRVPNYGVWDWLTTSSGSDLYIDHGGVWAGMDANTKAIENGVVWTSALTIPSRPKIRSANTLLLSSGGRGVVPTTVRTFDFAGSVGGDAGTTVVMTVGTVVTTVHVDELTLLHSGQRPDALGRICQSPSSLGGLASVTGLCPTVGDLNHPRSSPNATLNNAAA
jgi:hypothetical protein